MLYKGQSYTPPVEGVTRYLHGGLGRSKVLYGTGLHALFRLEFGIQTQVRTQTSHQLMLPWCGPRVRQLSHSARPPICCKNAVSVRSAPVTAGHEIAISMRVLSTILLAALQSRSRWTFLEAFDQMYVVQRAR